VGGQATLPTSPILRLAKRLGVSRPRLVADIAEACGIATSAVSQWPRVPAGRVPMVASVMGVERWELRPDLWDAPKRRRAREQAAS